MTREILGIHHVTAITSDAQKNVDFYVGVLGQRLVKVTINFDDPGSYHLYYGDDLGRPGTAMTFFAWPGGYALPRERRRGTRLATATSYAAPLGSLGFWQERLTRFGVQTKTFERFGAQGLAFEDGDGLALEIIEQSGVENRPYWAGAGIDGKFALRGFYGVTLTEADAALTGRFLSEILVWQAQHEDGQHRRFQIGDGSQTGAFVDVLNAPGVARGGTGPGIVHHVAWRVTDEPVQLEWHKKIADVGANISQVMDRTYFRSIYFREPGGVLFEIATDQPGFTLDQSAEELGKHLKLPPWLESARGQIEKVVPRLRLPDGSELP